MKKSRRKFLLDSAIVGASADTGALPPIFHEILAYGAIAANVFALKVEISALTGSSSIVDEVNRLLDS